MYSWGICDGLTALHWAPLMNQRACSSNSADFRRGAEAAAEVAGGGRGYVREYVGVGVVIGKAFWAPSCGRWLLCMKLGNGGAGLVGPKPGGSCAFNGLRWLHSLDNLPMVYPLPLLQ
jgi:hypothetical protein